MSPETACGRGHGRAPEMGIGDVKIERWAARGALTATRGYLNPNGRGYTHTFNPAVGCAFARGFCGAFCYAQGFAARIAGGDLWGRRLLVKEGVDRILEEELVRAHRRDPAHPRAAAKIRVFSASTTDPCAPPLIDLYRRCLAAVARHPVGRWVLQTRSPAVLRLEREIRALAGALVVSFTLETDDPGLWRGGPAGAPSVAARRRAFERMASWPVRRHLAVSPCLPLADPRRFADWIARYATDATVDSFVCGDGSGGARTARSAVPALLERLGHDWRAEEQARTLYELLRARMEERVAWSVAGFLRLAAPAEGASR